MTKKTWPRLSVWPKMIILVYWEQLDRLLEVLRRTKLYFSKSLFTSPWQVSLGNNGDKWKQEAMWTEHQSVLRTVSASSLLHLWFIFYLPVVFLCSHVKLNIPEILDENRWPKFWATVQYPLQSIHVHDTTLLTTTSTH